MHLGCYPNPFNPQTTISFDLPLSTVASLRVYDVTGRLVRTLLNSETVKQGGNEFVWRGGDDLGYPVASGVYIYSLQAGVYSVTSTIVLVK